MLSNTTSNSNNDRRENGKKYCLFQAVLHQVYPDRQYSFIITYELYPCKYFGFNPD